MYGKEYTDWLEGERQDEILARARASIDFCSASFDGHDLRPVQSSPRRHYYECRKCEAVIGLDPLTVAPGRSLLSHHQV